MVKGRTLTVTEIDDAALEAAISRLKLFYRCESSRGVVVVVVCGKSKVESADGVSRYLLLPEESKSR